jgi:hypothetical protein
MHAGIGDSSTARGPWFVDVQVLDEPMFADQPGDMQAGDFAIFRAEKNVGSNVIDSGS